ncbi:hypothetical protein [Methanobacterium bryantii]|uniref:Uncharacterized protein n=1 Tax=Methanobacterium bryantii TaxID=2161 RepID=A0A2A2H7M9_METBR|nr:hypothetical protein [Methanobacterium bryantii]PAV05461.1 hypothetical protein ASJ80_09440 [Methanobacterium bryantii]
MSIIDEIIQYFSEGKNFQKLIAPIIIKKDSNGDYDPVELLNRLAYTIVDQQRDVASIVIPIWVNMMYKDINPDFLAKSPYATEFVQSMFKAYGHQNYHSKTDFEIRGKGGASRTDAFVQAYNEYSPDEFLDFIKHNSSDIESIFKELVKLKYISLKSASFFLRDVEGLEYDILPIDVNVAYSFQYTGLFFKDNSLNSFDEVLKEIIPVSKRTNIVEYSKISDRMQELCSELGYNPYELNRYLFLLGADFCQSLKCKSCFLRENCYFNDLSSECKEKFVSRIKSD